MGHSVVERALSTILPSSSSSSTQNKGSVGAQAVPAALVWTLRIVVAVQCLGAAWATSVGMSPVAETLFFDLGLSETLAVFVDQAAVALMVGSAAAVLLWRSRVVPVVVASWFLLLALSHWYRGGAPFADWSLASHAVRYVAPVALAWVLPTRRGELFGDTGMLEWLLRGATAATFLAHGLEALSVHPRFLDYLIVTANQLAAYDLSQAAARQILYVIGAVDVVVAVAVLLARRWLWLLAYMALWGIVTAASRVVFGGMDKGYMTLIRAANGGVPLALWMWMTHRHSKPQDTPTSPSEKTVGTK